MGTLVEIPSSVPQSCSKCDDFDKDDAYPHRGVCRRLKCLVQADGPCAIEDPQYYRTLSDDQLLSLQAATMPSEAARKILDEELDHRAHNAGLPGCAVIAVFLAFVYGVAGQAGGGPAWAIGSGLGVATAAYFFARLLFPRNRKAAKFGRKSGNGT